MIRYSLPKIPEGWDTLKNPQTCMRPSPKTYSYVSYSIASSAMQKSIRRGLWPESAFWMMECFKSGPPMRTNIVRRLLIIASEDVGAGNLSILLLVDDLLDLDSKCEVGLEDIESVIAVVAILTASYKDRSFSWLGSYLGLSYERQKEDIHEDLVSELECLDKNLEDRNLTSSSSNLCKIFEISRKHPNFLLSSDLKKSLKSKFKTSKLGIKFGNFSKIIPQVWRVFLSVIDRRCFAGTLEPRIETFITRTYKILCSRSGKFSFRNLDNGDMKAFLIHICYVLCKEEHLLRSWYEDDLNFAFDLPDCDKDEMFLELHRKHESRELRFDIPDYAIDQHTSSYPGVPSKGFKEFLEQGSKINFACPETKEFSTKVMLNVVKRAKMTKRLPKDYVLKTKYI